MFLFQAEKGPSRPCQAVLIFSVRIISVSEGVLDAALVASKDIVVDGEGTKGSALLARRQYGCACSRAP